jgi:hypothetical protein
MSNPIGARFPRNGTVGDATRSRFGEESGARALAPAPLPLTVNTSHERDPARKIATWAWSSSASTTTVSSSKRNCRFDRSWFVILSKLPRSGSRSWPPRLGPCLGTPLGYRETTRSPRPAPFPCGRHCHRETGLTGLSRPGFSMIPPEVAKRFAAAETATRKFGR